MEATHVKGAKSLRWFRVLQDLNLIEGRGEQQEKVVEDHIISEEYVFLDISHSLGCLVENSVV